MESAITIMPSGKAIDLKNFSEKDIDLFDITQELNRILRFRGNGMSVLRHTMLMFEFAKSGHPTIADAWGPVFGHKDGGMLGILLHDASEAYTGDIPTPTKRAVPAIELLEQSIQDKVKLAFSVPQLSIADKSRIKTIDLIAMALEYEFVFNAPHSTADEAWGFRTIDPRLVDTMRQIYEYMNYNSETLLHSYYYWVNYYATKLRSNADRN